MKSRFINHSKPFGVLPGIFAILLLVSPGNAVADYQEDKQRFEEKKQRELERMEAREEKAKSRASQKRKAGESAVAESLNILNGAKNLFELVSELKRRHDAALTGKLPADVISLAQKIHGEIARLDKDLSHLKNGIATGARSADAVLSDAEADKAMARKLEADTERLAEQAYRASLDEFNKEVARCRTRLATIAAKTPCLNWDKATGLSCALPDEMSDAEQSILSAWQELEQLSRATRFDGKSHRAFNRSRRSSVSGNDSWGDSADSWGSADSRSGFSSSSNGDGYLESLSKLEVFLANMEILEKVADDNADAWKRKKRDFEEKRRRIAEEKAERAAEREREMQRIPPLIRRKSLCNRPFTVFQVFDDGKALCIDQLTGSVFSLLFSHENNRSVVDGDKFRQDLYWCGTYSYTTVKGAPKKVSLFAIDLEVAIQEAEEQEYDLYE